MGIYLKNWAKVNKIRKEFLEHGFNVAEKDIMAMFNSWKDGWKTGLRNDAKARNYHLFSPCGGNPFSLRCSSLHPKCADWQISYQC